MSSIIQRISLLTFLLLCCSALQAQDCGCGEEPVSPEPTTGGRAIMDWNPCEAEATGFIAELAAWECCRKKCAEAERERQIAEDKERYEEHQREKERQAEEAERQRAEEESNQEGLDYSENDIEVNLGWDEDDSLFDDEDSYNEESVYQRKQREAREAEDRRIAHERAERERINNSIEAQNRANQQMEQEAQQNLQDWNNMWDNAQRAAAEKANREREQRQREQQARWEREKREKEEARRQRQIEQERYERKKAIEDAKENFMQSLSDHEIPLFYDHPQAFLLLVSKASDEELKMIPVLLYKNSDNQLPYKQDVVNTVKTSRNLRNVKVYGVYSSFEELKEASRNLYSQGSRNYVIVTETKKMEFGKPQTAPKNQGEKETQEDFWGNPSEKPKTETDDDFWND
jgi:DNA repair exonuclease SbcCD ATPase subunit